MPFVLVVGVVATGLVSWGGRREAESVGASCVDAATASSPASEGVAARGASAACNRKSSVLIHDVSHRFRSGSTCITARVLGGRVWKGKGAIRREIRPNFVFIPQSRGGDG